MKKIQNILAQYPTALYWILGSAALVYTLSYIVVLTNNPEAVYQHGENSHRNAALYMLEHGAYPITHRLPIYPLVIAGIYQIFGLNNDLPLIILLAITSLSTMVLAYLIAERLFTRQAGVWAAGLLALELHVLHNSYSADFPDAFFMFFMTLAAYLTLRCFDPQVTIGRILISASFIAFSAWVKPIAYYLPILVVMLLFAYTFRQFGLKRSIQLTSIYIATVTLIIGGWQYRNYEQTGYGVFTQMKGFHFLFYTGAYILAEHDDKVSFTEMQTRLKEKYYQDPEIQAMDPERTPDKQYFFSPARDKRLFQDAVEIIKEHPFTYLYVSLRGMAKTMFWGCRDYALNFYSATQRAEIVAAPESGQKFATLRLSWEKGYYFLFLIHNGSRLFSLLLWPAVLLGMIQFTLKRPLRLDLVFLIITIAYLAFTAGAVGHIRYRLPYESLSVVFAGAALASLAARLAIKKYTTDLINKVTRKIDMPAQAARIEQG